MTKISKKLKLRRFLGRLGIKSAQVSALEDALLAGMEMIASDFGTPDRLYMSAKDFEQIQKLNKDKK